MTDLPSSIQCFLTRAASRLVAVRADMGVGVVQAGGLAQPVRAVRVGWLGWSVWGTWVLQLAFVASLLAAVSPAQAKRIALVMGNDNYQSVSKLQKAGNDAVAMATELRAAGFEVVLHKDLNYRGMVRAFEALYNSITGGDEVVVFYAGHGVQIKNGSFLLPTDIEANSESEVEKTSYSLNDMMEHLTNAKASFSLVMIDACRDNPLKSARSTRAIGNSRGLNPPDPPKGQMIVYSASRGQQALDRLSDADGHPNSVFTREFIARMRKPGLRVEDLVREIQDSVESLARSVSHDQRPAFYNEARGNFYFFAPVATAALQAGSAVQGAVNEAQREDRFWEDTKSAGNREGFEAYLGQYPAGRYASLARANINRLQAGNASTAGLSTGAVTAAIANTASLPTGTASGPSGAQPAHAAVTAAMAAAAPGGSIPARPPAQAQPQAAAAGGTQVAAAQQRTRTTAPMRLPNGDTYEGEIIGVTRVGLGVYTFANGDRYEGQFQNNLFHGKGMQTYASGDVYRGDFVNNTKTGQGIYAYANGDRYEGGFQDNLLHGKGLHSFKSGDAYEGQFSLGEKIGKGIYRFSNGDRFEGTFQNNQFNGPGVMIFANGDRYEGEFRNNVKDGKGVHFFATKDRYEGAFSMGNQAGAGTHFYANGDRYTGGFSNGVRHGKGTYFFTTGQTREFEFDNGVEKPR